MIGRSNLLFSIVIPTHNRAHRIGTALDSVLKQSYENWECIIIDDGSTDKTKEVILTYLEDQRFQYYYQENSERCISRNNGISKAKGEFICFLDSDDYYLPNHLQTLNEQIVKSGTQKALYFTNAFNKKNQEEVTERLCPNYYDINKFEYILTYTFNPSRVCIERLILNDFHFDPVIPGLEDLDMWLRIAVKFNMVQIRERTVVYNLFDDSYTIAESNKWQKELSYFQYIFAKEELINVLPQKAKNRLLSMCRFHLGQKAERKKEIGKMYTHYLKSFILFPSSYNGKTNKIMMVSMVYNLPIIGKLIRLIKNS